MPVIFLLALGHPRRRNGCCGESGEWYEGARAACCLLASRALPRTPTTYYVTISGLGGEPDYEQRFKMWADEIDGSLKKAGGDANVITLAGAHARADPRAVRRDLASRPSPPTRWC